MTGSQRPARVDPVIHPITRLSICGLLAASGTWVEFAALRDAVEISDSVLSKQSRTLEEAGYLEVRKGAVGRRPRTWFRLSTAGREAFAAHVAWLEHAAHGSPEPAGQSGTERDRAEHRPARTPRGLRPETP